MRTTQVAIERPAVEDGHGPEAWRRVLIDGGVFAFEGSAEIAAVWGSYPSVLWASGEPLMIVAPSGVGKTTMAQQLLRARLGLDKPVLGQPVEPGERKVLYIAADRPMQAARSFRRMVSEDDYGTLAYRLRVWRGPLPDDLARHPETLLSLAEAADADTVIVDSLKDVATKLSDDEVGAKVNRALQYLVANGVEVVVLHHQRKAQAGGGKPKALDDVYGSTWLTAGAGSVLLLWGEAGDSLVELTHLKQPAEPVGPWTLRHDHDAGRTVIHASADVWELVRTAKRGVTAQEVARAMFTTSDPKPNQVERARRRLDRLVAEQMATRQAGSSGGPTGGQQARYFAATMLDGLS